MAENMDKQESLDEEKAVAVLNKIYGKVLSGVPKVSKPVEVFAQDYLSKNESPEKAAKAPKAAATSWGSGQRRTRCRPSVLTTKQRSRDSQPRSMPSDAAMRTGSV